MRSREGWGDEKALWQASTALIKMTVVHVLMGIRERKLKP